MLLRAFKVVLGLVLIGIGVAMIPVPGPWSVPVIGVGAGLALAQSEPGRRTLARIRLAARDRFGSERVREVEKRFPREVVEPDTTQMRLDLEAYAKERAKRERRKRR